MTHFRSEEFDCRCCGANEMQPEFLALLEQAREISHVPYRILSGYRCAKHNDAVGSTSNNHVRGVAADIQAVDGPARGRILRGLYLSGFRRIGIGKTYIHCDINNGPESCWLY